MAEDDTGEEKGVQCYELMLSVSVRRCLSSLAGAD